MYFIYKEMIKIYYFVIAALLSVISLVVVLKVNLDKVIDDPKRMYEVQKSFLIGVALSKIIPVVLIIIGIVQMKQAEMNDLIVPIIVILVALLAAFIYMSYKKKINAKEEVTIAVHTLVKMARPLLFSIPLMAIIFLWLMTQ